MNYRNNKKMIDDIMFQKCYDLWLKNEHQAHTQVNLQLFCNKWNSLIEFSTHRVIREFYQELKLESNKANCCNKPIIAFDEDKNIYNCLNCNKEIKGV